MKISKEDFDALAGSVPSQEEVFALYDVTLGQVVAGVSDRLVNLDETKPRFIEEAAEAAFQIFLNKLYPDTAPDIQQSFSTSDIYLLIACCVQAIANCPRTPDAASG